MEKGKIIKLTDRGYGFIAKENGDEKDLFFHVNSFDGDFDELKEGDEVVFDIENGEKGLAAVNVKKA